VKTIEFCANVVCMLSRRASFIGDVVTVGGPGISVFMPRDVPHCMPGGTPAAGGDLIEALPEHRPDDEDERNPRFERHRWKVVGPNPL
jgi:hypothetical protein